MTPLLQLRTVARWGVRGLGTVWDTPDIAGERIARGAASAAVEAVRAGARLPLYYEHGGVRTGAPPVGEIYALDETDAGLEFSARLWATPMAREALHAVRRRTVTGASIGFGAPKMSGDTVRSLDLLEISLTAFPRQPLARVRAERMTAAAPSQAPIMAAADMRALAADVRRVAQELRCPSRST